LRGKIADYPIPEALGGKPLDAPIPENGLVYDFFYVVIS
jgi:hypothetical protein